jgi:hypothetical protein
MTFVQPVLPLWDEPLPDFRSRVVADSTDRAGWMRARRLGVTATDVARLSSARSVAAVVAEKIYGSTFSGNAYTDHGIAREPAIAHWVHRTHGIAPSTTLFHANGRPLHLATPDGVCLRDGAVLLCEIKTTSSTWHTIPRSYLRQIWWQQYVLGAERTLFVWEQHHDFVPVPGDPRCVWVERDDNQIHMLMGLADRVLEAMAQQSPTEHPPLPR